MIIFIPKFVYSQNKHLPLSCEKVGPIIKQTLLKFDFSYIYI